MLVVKKGAVVGKGVQVVYVGRPSVLGNPFVIGRDGDRATVVDKYLRWLREQWATKRPARDELLRLAERVRNGEQLAFECWCAEKPRAAYGLEELGNKKDACHGDVIAYSVAQLLKGGV
jgi:hypothetical protein